MIFPLASSWVYSLFFTLSMIAYIFVCVIMTLLVLIQKGRGGGLAGAFGGGGGNTAFGAKTGDVLTWATSVVFLIFLVLAITLNRLADYASAESTAQAHSVMANVAHPTTEPAPIRSAPSTTQPSSPGSSSARPVPTSVPTPSSPNDMPSPLAPTTAP